jgi:hypothetical protein
MPSTLLPLVVLVVLVYPGLYILVPRRRHHSKSGSKAACRLQELVNVRPGYIPLLSFTYFFSFLFLFFIILSFIISFFYYFFIILTKSLLKPDSL